jgi:hypothetical protein
MRAAIDRVDHAGAIAARVIGVAGDVILGIGNRLNQPGRIVRNGRGVVQRIEAAALLPDDPRPLLYEGLCYERLTGIAQSPEEKRQLFALGEAALRKALTLNVDAPDYSVALPYRALASLYAHVNDFRSVLDSLKNARQADPISAESTHIDREIQNVAEFLAKEVKNR